MSETRGHIELDRALDSITVGARHRKDPGDLAKLAESIDRLGLLQPITITTDGVLVCGWRRLEAVRRLGWKSMKVWVRSGISDKLTALLAQQDDNQLHKPLNELEQVAHSTFNAIIGRMAAYSGKTLKWDEVLHGNKWFEDTFPKKLSMDLENLPVDPVPVVGEWRPKQTQG